MGGMNLTSALWSPVHVLWLLAPAEREYLTGVIRVQVKEARELKVKPSEWTYVHTYVALYVLTVYT